MSKKKKKVFDPWEQMAWSPPPEETIDSWAERVLVLPRGVSAISGPLSLELTPYLREPLRAVTDPFTEEVVLCTSTQVGKTTFLLICTLYYMANDPWNMFHIMPTEDEAMEVKRERYIPIIHESPDLAALIGGKPQHHLAGDTIRANNCTITFRGSRSPSGLASKPAKIAIADEIDKWDVWTGVEADPLDLLGERLKTFHDSKYLKCSTPTTPEGRIWQEYLGSTAESYHVPCPLCGGYQVLVFGDGSSGSPGIKWPRDERDGEKISAERLAWYECKYCQGRIEEAQKRQMVMGGVWAPKGSRVDEHGKVIKPAQTRRKRGFHLWAGYSLWPKAGWSQIAAEFLKSKDVPSSLMNFRNSWLAEPWQRAVHELEVTHLDATVEAYKEGTAPGPCREITAGVDVQQAGSRVYQYFVLRAWAKEGTSYLLRAGITPDWAALYRLLFESQYRDTRGNVLPISIVLVDSGFATDQVYQFCEMYQCWAAKGDTRSQRPFTPTEAETAPQSGRYLRRVNVNSDYFKSQLHHSIRGGKFHIPEDISQEYKSHILAEQLVPETQKSTGRVRYKWSVVPAGRPNHFLDCEVLALCGAEMLELRYQRPIAQPRSPQAVAAPQVRQIRSRVFS